MNSELQVIYHRDTVKYHSSKHPEERVYFWRFPIPGVWKCGQTLSWMYDISSQSKLKLRRQRWNKNIIKSTPNKTRDLNVTLSWLRLPWWKTIIIIITYLNYYFCIIIIIIIIRTEFEKRISRVIYVAIAKQTLISVYTPVLRSCSKHFLCPLNSR